jgi:hypothetical protein
MLQTRPDLMALCHSPSASGGGGVGHLAINMSPLWGLVSADEGGWRAFFGDNHNIVFVQKSI